MGKIPPLRMLFVGAVVSLGGSFHFVFQLCVTNPAQESLISFMNGSHADHYGWGLPYTQAVSLWSAIVATYSIGAIFGSLPISYVGERFGRKGGLYISFGLTVLAVILAIVSFHAYSFELYTVSRFIMGVAVTLSLGLAGMFLNESSPKECRGFVSTMASTFGMIGALCSAIIGMQMVLGTEDLWWYLYVTELVILIIVLAILPFIPESPGYLLQMGDEEGARKAILFFHCCGEEGVDEPLNDIKENLKMSTTKMTFMDVYNDHYSWKGMLVGMVVTSASCFSGNSLMNTYAVNILRETGLSPQSASYGNIVLVGFLLIASTSSSFIMDRLGRRIIALTSNGVIVILNMFIFALLYCFQKYELNWIGYCLIATIALSQFAFSSGIGPLCYFIGTETVGQSARGISQSWATLAQMISRTIVVAVFLPLSQVIGQAFAFFILSVPPMIFTFVYMFFCLPETKNRNYNEIVAEMKKLPTLSKICRRRKVHDEYDFPITKLEGSYIEGKY